MDACNCTAMTSNFHILSTSLLMYLNGLKFCQCEMELDFECQESTYNWTSYHSLIYDKMCDEDQYKKICDNNKLKTNDELYQECRQIEQYKRGVAYKEWFIPYSPFCPMYGFGASQDEYNRDPSVAVPYNNMDGFCKRATVFAMGVFILLCISIIIANVTVLLVVRSDQYFHTPYGYFKASIALADLCVGLLVVPLLMYIFHQETFRPKPFLLPGQFPNPSKDHHMPYLHIAGFFTIFSLSVSVYSLAASSLDRYFSIARPFHYNAKKLFTRSRSLIVIVVVWLLSVIYGLFPFMSSSTDYSMVSATFVLAAQRPSQHKQTNAFDWTSLFNATSMTSTKFDNRNGSFISTQITDSYTMSSLRSPSKSPSSDSSETAMYVTLSLYLMSLIIPLVVVWTVNMCTAQAYRKNLTPVKLATGVCLKFSKPKHTVLNATTRVAFSLPLQSIIVPASTSCRPIRCRVCKKHNCGKEMYPQHQRIANLRTSSIQKNISLPTSNEISVPASPPLITNPEPALSNVSSTERDPKLFHCNDENQNRTISSEKEVSKKNNFLQRFRSPLVQPKPAFRLKTKSRSSSTTSDMFFNSTSSSVTAKTSNKSRSPFKKQVSNSISKRLQRVLLRMVVAFTLSLLPSICALVISIMFAPYTDIYNTKRYSVKIKFFENCFWYICSIFLFGNSFVNCIIYTVLGKRFRSVTKQVYSGRIHATRRALRRVSSAFESFSYKSSKFRSSRQKTSVSHI